MAGPGVVFDKYSTSLRKLVPSAFVRLPPTTLLSTLVNFNSYYGCNHQCFYLGRTWLVFFQFSDLFNVGVLLGCSHFFLYASPFRADLINTRAWHVFRKERLDFSEVFELSLGKAIFQASSMRFDAGQIVALDSKHIVVLHCQSDLICNCQFI